MHMPIALDYRSISSQTICEEAEKLWLQVDIVSKENNLFYISSPTKKILFKSTDFGGNSALWYKIADNKEITGILLSRHNIATPKSVTISALQYDKNSLDKQTQGLSFPLVAKPIDEAHGNGVMMSIDSTQELKSVLDKLLGSYDSIIIQEQIQGDEVRVLVVRWQVILAKNRIPAHIVGDGTHTIQDLIAKKNDNPIRGKWYDKPLAEIDIDAKLHRFLKKQGLDIDAIPDKWTYIQLRGTSNLWTGGSMQDVTDTLCDDIKDTCIHVADIFWLDICGIDIISPDISVPFEKNGWVILEVNATPSIAWDRELSNTNSAKKTLELLFFSS